METRFVPDAPGAWLVYDLGAMVLALPREHRAAADAAAATAPSDVAGALAALRAAGLGAAAPFAVVDLADGRTRVALRGPATVAAGPRRLTGVGAEPWLEATVDDATDARLTVPGGEWTLVPVAAPDIAAPTSAPPASRVVGPPPLLEITEVPEVESSAPIPPAPAVPPPPTFEALDEPGEHDGHTVLVSDLPRTIDPAGDDGDAGNRSDSGDGSDDGDERTVVVDEVARLRARRTSGLADPIITPPRAPELSLELPDGSREPLDAVVLVGRAPAAPVGGAVRLIRLADGDISRTHARVAVEGGTVVVTDLNSRNGTVVRIPGRDPLTLRGGEPTPVLVGTVIDFGGGVELRVREG